MANLLPALEGLNQLLLKQFEEKEKQKKKDTSSLLMTEYNTKLGQAKTVQEVNSITTNFIAEAIKYGVPEVVNYAQSMQSSTKENAMLAETKGKEIKSTETYLNSMKDYKFAVGDKVSSFDDWTKANNIDSSMPLTDLQNLVSNTVLESNKELSFLPNPTMTSATAKEFVTYKNKGGKTFQGETQSELNMYYDPDKKEVKYYKDANKDSKPNFIETKDKAGKVTGRTLDPTEQMTEDEILTVRQSVMNTPKMAELVGAFGNQSQSEIDKVLQRQKDEAYRWTSLWSNQKPDPAPIDSNSSSDFLTSLEAARTRGTGSKRTIKNPTTDPRELQERPTIDVEEKVVDTDEWRYAVSGYNKALADNDGPTAKRFLDQMKKLAGK